MVGSHFTDIFFFLFMDAHDIRESIIIYIYFLNISELYVHKFV